MWTLQKLNFMWLSLILIWAWAFFQSSLKMNWGDIQFEVYSRKHPEFVMGISRTIGFFPNGIEYTKLTIGLVIISFSVNFYKFPN